MDVLYVQFIIMHNIPKFDDIDFCILTRKIITPYKICVLYLIIVIIVDRFDCF